MECGTRSHNSYAIKSRDGDTFLMNNLNEIIVLLKMSLLIVSPVSLSMLDGKVVSPWLINSFSSRVGRVVHVVLKLIRFRKRGGSS
jgi:hypothetical protein